METCIKIKIFIAIMQATVISYQKSTRQQILNQKQMDIPELHGTSAPPRGQTYIGYITTACTSSSDQTHKQKFVWVSRQKPARGRQHRSTTQRRVGALDL